MHGYRIRIKPHRENVLMISLKTQLGKTFMFKINDIPTKDIIILIEILKTTHEKVVSNIHNNVATIEAITKKETN